MHFMLLSIFSKISYRMDARKLFQKKEDNNLTKNQKKNIRNYWYKYTKDLDLTYHKYYINRSGIFDVKYIPDDLYSSKIDPYLNNRIIDLGFSDKNYFDMYFKGYKLPKTYIHLINGFFLDNEYNIISLNDAKKILANTKEFVIKPSVTSYGGRDVLFFHEPSLNEINDLLDSLPSKNLIFQEVIKQSKITESFHKDSINTIRIITLLIDNKVRILHSVLRYGVNNSRVDNANSGGRFCGINEDGTFYNTAFDLYGNEYNLPIDETFLSKYKIPCMGKINSLVTDLAQKFPHFRLISWDIALDSYNEPVIIEANFNMGDVDIIQPIFGPFFGKYTDDVLNEVYFNKPNDFINPKNYYDQFI